MLPLFQVALKWSLTVPAVSWTKTPSPTPRATKRPRSGRASRSCRSVSLKQFPFVMVRKRPFVVAWRVPRRKCLVGFLLAQRESHEYADDPTGPSRGRHAQRRRRLRAGTIGRAFLTAPWTRGHLGHRLPARKQGHGMPLFWSGAWSGAPARDDDQVPTTTLDQAPADRNQARARAVEEVALGMCNLLRCGRAWLGPGARRPKVRLGHGSPRAPAPGVRAQAVHPNGIRPRPAKPRRKGHSCGRDVIVTRYRRSWSRFYTADPAYR